MGTLTKKKSQGPKSRYKRLNMARGHQKALAQKRNAKKKKNSNTSIRSTVSMSYQCKICFSSFMSTASRTTLEAHLELRHSGTEFDAAFPDYGADASTSTSNANNSNNSNNSGNSTKKKKKKRRQP